MLIQLLMNQLVEYLKAKKSIEGDEKSIKTQIVGEKHRFFLFKDPGIQRAQFLFEKIDQWVAAKSTDKQILDEVCLIFTQKKEPPKGLGNSTSLRAYVAIALAQFLKVKIDFEAERHKIERDYMGRGGWSDPVVLDHQIEGASTVQAITLMKMKPKIFDIAREAIREAKHRQSIKDQRWVFAQGLHQKTGADGEETPLYKFGKNSIYDRQVSLMVLDFLDDSKQSALPSALRETAGYTPK